MKYKIIIFDIGKTLFDKNVSNQISPQVLSDIKALKQMGIKVGVCSMRTLRHCLEIIPVELDFYICLNGSYIICDGKLIFDSPLECCQKLSEGLNIVGQNSYAASVEKCQKSSDDLKVIGQNSYVVSIEEYQKSLDYLSYGADYVFYSSEKAKQKALKNGFLIDKHGDTGIVYNRVLFDILKEQVADYTSYNIEYWENTQTLSLQNVDSSKSLGIQRVLDYYGLQEPILYFGDGPNDLSIFQQYRDCVCMGDCYPELCKYALFQTKSCKDDGICYALRKLKILS